MFFFSLSKLTVDWNLIYVLLSYPEFRFLFLLSDMKVSKTTSVSGVLREMEVQCQGGRFHPLRCARNLDVALLLLFQVARKFPKRKGTLRISQEAKRG